MSRPKVLLPSSRCQHDYSVETTEHTAAAVHRLITNAIRCRGVDSSTAKKSADNATVMMVEFMSVAIFFFFSPIGGISHVAIYFFVLLYPFSLASPRFPKARLTMSLSSLHVLSQLPHVGKGFTARRLRLCWEPCFHHKNNNREHRDEQGQTCRFIFETPSSE